MVKPMRVVLLSDFGHINGGAAKVAINSALALAESGIRIDFVHAVGPVDTRLHRRGITLHHFDTPSVWSVSNPFAAVRDAVWNQAVRRRLGKLLDTFDPDVTVVHAHQWSKALSPSAVAEPIYRRFRTAVTLHDYFIACPNGALYDFQAAQPCDRRPMSPSCVVCNCDSRSYKHKVVRLARHARQDYALNRIGWPDLIHVSDFAMRMVKPWLPHDSRNHVVQNPVDARKNGRAEVEKNQYFVCIGRLTPEKGVVEIATAAADAGVSIVFVGAGPAEPDIRKVNPAAKITGWISSGQVRAILRRSRAVVFASTWYETGGLVCSEALANGVPAIVSRMTGPADLVRHGQNGMLISPGNRAEIVAAMSKLSDRAQAKSMSENACGSYWAAPNTMDDHVQSLLEVYSKMLTRSVAPART